MELKGRGCIKLTRGDWTVRRRGKNGEMKISKRRPSDREREANRRREKNRRRVANNIFSGLRTSGEFSLPKHPDRNDILIALCHQAGYNVAEDGTVSRMSFDVPEVQSGPTTNLGLTSSNLHIPEVQREVEEELSLELTLSYKYM